MLFCSIVGAVLFGLGFIAANGPSFEAKDEAAKGQTCAVSATMFELQHCTKGSYSISEFCEWDRKGTLRSKFCGKSLAVEVMMYTAASMVILATILGFAFCVCGKVLQLFAGMLIFVLWIIAGILCVIIGVVWTSAAGDLPGVKVDATQTAMYEALGERGVEWVYLPKTAPGSLEWDVAWACVLTYVGTALALACVVCAFLGVKNLCDGIVIRVDVKQAEVLDSITDGMFIDGVIGTTGVITGVTIDSQPCEKQASPIILVSKEVTVELDTTLRPDDGESEPAQV